jgi:hypothetical protein
MKWFLLFVLFLPMSLFARLGESEGELVIRYGKIKNKNIVPAGYQLRFEKGDFEILCTIIDARCGGMRIQRLDKTEINYAEIEKLLERNFPPPNNKYAILFEKDGKKYFKISEGFAVYMKGDNSLIMMSKEGFETTAKQTDGEADSKTAGF